jgi:DNA polymerase I-like protein with 3'-5' exonuclease and polymerase domains
MKKKVLYTLSPQQLAGTPIYGRVVKMDCHRAKLFLNGSYPAPIPELKEWHGIYDSESFNNAPFVVIDTEYNYTNEMERPQDRAIQLTLIGLYGPGTPVLQADWPRLTSFERFEFIDWLRKLISKQVIVFQNTLADIAVLDKFCGIDFSEYKETHDTMYAHACLWAELPHNLEFLASVYGKHQKLKHLSRENPLLYNAGDVLETANTWVALEKELRQDVKSKNVYENYLLPLRNIIYESENRGIRVQTNRVMEVKETLEKRTKAAIEIAQAYVGYPINLNSSDQVIQALLADGVKLRSTKADVLVDKRNSFLAVESNEDLNEVKMFERIDEGAHPLLEARASFIQADKQLSAYINPLFRVNGTIQERVYPHFLPTAQDNGRWSTTNPPLAQTPDHLRDIYIPDVGYPWVGWDWDQIELRIFAAMAKDELLLEAFDKKWDLHTLTFCEVFGHPFPQDKSNPHESDVDKEWRDNIKWEGKDDKRRRFCKVFVYRLMYGGDPKNASGIPGAKKLGLSGKELVAGSYRWLSKHPRLDSLWRRFKEGAIKQGEARSFLGRRRKLLERNLDRRVRQSYDQPMQAGCSDVFNHTIIEVKRRFNDTSFIYGMHDSLKFSIPLTKLAEYVPQILEIGSKTWDIEGTPMRFTLTPHLYFAPEDEHLRERYEYLVKDFK